MASFQSNQQNDSVKGVKRYAPSPTTTRGSSLHISGHPTLPLLVYPNRKCIIVRNIEDGSSSFIYRGHSAYTTVAKFSPNGEWIAS